MRMIPGVTSAYLDVLKFLEGLDPRHTTPTVKSVSFMHLLYTIGRFQSVIRLRMDTSQVLRQSRYAQNPTNLTDRSLKPYGNQCKIIH